MDFDTERFIREIKQRPALWDSTYPDKQEKMKTWEELSTLFGANDCGSSAEKVALCTALRKKWRNIKDSFIREKRRLNNVNSSSTAARKSPYIYYNQLYFLNGHAPSRDTHPQILPDEENAETSQDTQTKPTRFKSRVLVKKRKAKETVGQTLIKILKDSAEFREKRESEEQDEDRMFMLSLVKDLKKIPEHLKLSVKRRFLTVLEEAQLQVYPNISYSYPTEQYQQSATSNSTMATQQSPVASEDSHDVKFELQNNMTCFEDIE